MKKFLLVICLILSWSLGFCEEPVGQDWINSEYTWKYNMVYGDPPFVADQVKYTLSPMELKVVGTEAREGKEYRKLSWNSWIESYFLIREENGVWYTYIEYPETSPDNVPEVAAGEYLLYDFNMEEGDIFTAPYSYSFGFCGMGAQLEGYSDLLQEFGICHFRVNKKTTDEYGRRVLDLSCESGDDFWGYMPDDIKVVEGIGVLKDGNVAMYFFPPKTTGMRRDPTVEFYELVDEEDNVVYLDPNEREAGFVKERDYKWIYGVYDSEGNLNYRWMGFDYYEVVNDGSEGKRTAYRRFGTFGVSEYPDGPWTGVPFAARYVRNEEGKVWLTYREKNPETDKYESHRSLIYDFNAPDASELTIYTPEGDKTMSITTGHTRVDEKEVHSYTFDGSDGVKCVEGIGIVKGGILPCVNTEFKLPTSAEDNSYCGAVLVAVYDYDWNLIYSQNMPEGIGEVPTDADGWRSPETRIFDLQGRELTAPVPGQPYIKGGKVFVEGLR